ncbi:unnamed protein product, partial [Brugia pahangi]|uniref:Col_cuticle_N domain-containing protein n=1 Tax=Brugia pahangi TaxID=6280 RepID=A0A0N4TQZ1_BRUPA
MGLVTNVSIASAISIIVVLTCVIALTHLVNDLNSLYDEIMSDTQEIKVINENTWNGMLQLRARKTSRNNTSRPIHQFFLRRNLKAKRSFASQQCECGQNPNNCPRGKQGLQGEKGELGGRLCFISTQEPGEPGTPGLPGVAGIVAVLNLPESGCVQCPAGP